MPSTRVVLTSLMLCWHAKCLIVQNKIAGLSARSALVDLAEVCVCILRKLREQIACNLPCTVAPAYAEWIHGGMMHVSTVCVLLLLVLLVSC